MERSYEFKPAKGRATREPSGKTPWEQPGPGERKGAGNLKCMRACKHAGGQTAYPFMRLLATFRHSGKVPDHP